MAINTGQPFCNTTDGYLCEGTDVKGSYFVIDVISNAPAAITQPGSLCYCTTESKFYYYSSNTWKEVIIPCNDNIVEINIDDKVRQNSLSSGDTNNYYLLASSTSSPTDGNAYEASYNTSVKLNGSGQLTASSFYATSDKRKKENIKEFIPQKSILDLPVVEFDFKDSGVHQIGCIAQDLQEICPEIVSADESGYLSINESKIVYLLLDEVKKLRKEVNELRNK